MIQGGDPTGTGMGGPGYQFEDEPNQHPVDRGVIAMANSGPNTNGSQFFIVTADGCPWLNGLHTVFGRVSLGHGRRRRDRQRRHRPADRPVDEIRIESVAISATATLTSTEATGCAASGRLTRVTERSAQSVRPGLILAVLSLGGAAYALLQSLVVPALPVLQHDLAHDDRGRRLGVHRLPARGVGRDADRRPARRHVREEARARHRARRASPSAASWPASRPPCR